MKITGENLNLFIDELKILNSGNLRNSPFGIMGSMGQSGHFIWNDLFKLAVKEAFEQKSGPDLFNGLLFNSDVSDSPIRNIQIVTPTNEIMNFVGSNLLELCAFMVEAHKAMGCPLYGFHTNKMLTQTTLGNCYYALNILLANTGFYGTARRRGLKRSKATFSNYAGTFSRNVHWIQGTFKTAVPEVLRSEMSSLMQKMKSSSNEFYLLDFPTYYITKTNNTVEIEVVVLNLLDFLIYDESRAEFEKAVVKQEKFTSIGEVIGYPDIPLYKRTMGMTLLKQTGVVECVSDKFEDIYAIFLNSVFWFDLVPYDMINLYVQKLQFLLKKSIIQVNFVKSTGELREMLCTMNKDVYLDIVKNDNLKNLVIDIELGYNMYINCLEVLDTKVATAESGITRNFKINKILSLNNVEIEKIKKEVIDMKVSPIVVEGVIRRVLTANVTAGEVDPDLEKLLGLDGVDYTEDILWSTLNDCLINKSTVFIPQAYKYLVAYNEGYSEKQSIDWMNSFRMWLNQDYYVDVTAELVGLTDEAKKDIIDNYSKSTIIYVEYTSGKSIKVSKFGYYTKNREIMSYLYGDIFDKGPSGKTLYQQYNYLSKVCTAYFDNPSEPKDMMDTAKLFGLQIGGLSPAQVYKKLVVYQNDVYLRYIESREQVRDRMDNNVVYGLFSVMFDPEYLPKVVDFYSAVKPETVRCLKILDTRRIKG